MFHRKSILLSFWLLLPAFAVYLCYFVKTPKNSSATGFIQGDMYSYMAEARQYPDGENNGLLYSNPFDGDKNAPKIYFQPQVFLLGFLLKYTGLNPGILFLIFALIFGWLFMLSAINLYKQFFDLSSKVHLLGLFVFVYGGGLFFIIGFLRFVWFDLSTVEVFHFDPGYGWWMLNLGRNLIYPLESFYHFIVLMAFVMFFKKKHLMVCILLSLLSFSHPFYGIEFLLVFGYIYLIEFIVTIKQKSNSKNLLYPLFFVGILIFIHFYYYLHFLPSFPSHQSLMKQWMLNWSHTALSVILAYVFGIILTGIRIYKEGGFIPFFSESKNRVLSIWFIICFLFVNHQWFIPAFQPLHFDKGYVLAPLWLMGLPALFEGIKHLKNSLPKMSYHFILLLLIILLLSDNISWFIAARGDKNAYISNSERDVHDYLNSNLTSNDVIISNDDEFATKAMVCTPCRAWISHGYNTPDYAKRKEEISLFISEGALSSKIIEENHHAIFVFNKQILPIGFGFNERLAVLFENDVFIVVQLP